jgi:branched-chain amino acid transport system ATP-binding protein
VKQAKSYLLGENLIGGYGTGNILKGCTISAARGEIAVVVGPNGAGKSTAMKALLGMLKVLEGKIMLAGQDITNMSPQQRVQLGMAFVPQTNNVFSSMTVEENLELGAYVRTEDYSDTMGQVYELFPVLKEKRLQPAGELSGGQRQQVAVGRALMTKPSVLMLDEPTAGVSPIVMDELFERIIEIKKTGIAILMVEQNARQALTIADKGFVLVTGQNRFTDSGQVLLANEEVRRSFLGG